MGICLVRCRLLYTQTRPYLPCCYADAHGKLTVRHPDSNSGYLAALGECGRVLVVLLLDYPAVPGESGLVPTSSAPGRD
jgi:hypothetical protein